MKILMKSSLVAVLLAAAAQAAQVRTYDESWNSALSSRRRQPIDWFQAETVVLNLTAKRASTAIDLSGDDVRIVWEVAGWDDYTNAYIVATGTVVSATAGQVSITLDPDETNLPVGTYRGYVRAIKFVDGSAGTIGVLAYQTIRVLYSPDAAAYTYSNPIAGSWWTEGGDGALIPNGAGPGNSWHLNADGSITPNEE